MASDWNSGGPSPSMSAGQHALRVDGAVLGRMLHAGLEIDHDLLALEALEVHGDTDPQGRKRAPKAVELHVGSPVSAIPPQAWRLVQ